MATLNEKESNKVLEELRVAVSAKRGTLLEVARLVFSASTDLYQEKEGGDVIPIYMHWGYQTLEQFALKELCLEGNTLKEYAELWFLFGVKLDYRKNRSLKTALLKVSFERLSIVRHAITDEESAKKWLQESSTTLKIRDLKAKVNLALGRTSKGPVKNRSWSAPGEAKRIAALERVTPALMQKLRVNSRLQLLEALFHHCIHCPHAR